MKPLQNKSVWLFLLVIPALILLGTYLLFFYFSNFNCDADQESVTQAYRLAAVVLPNDIDYLPFTVKRKDKDWIEVTATRRGQTWPDESFTFATWSNNSYVILQRPFGVAVPGTYDLPILIVDENFTKVMEQKLCLGWRVFGAMESILQVDKVPCLVFEDSHGR